MKRLLARIALAAGCVSSPLMAVTLTTFTDAANLHQQIDGFGTCLGGAAELPWFQDLYFNDAQATIVRMDLVPVFKSPTSDFTYNSPWFHNTPPLPGPDNNNVRTYTSAADYGRTFAGVNSPIVVMGPDIDANATNFDYESGGPHAAGTMAQLGEAHAAALGGFKLIGSMWSPAPWLKISSGNTISDGGYPLPVGGTPWPFIWAGNFAGGKLDVSDTPLAVFNDGAGPTSALTQFARSTAAYLRGFQNRFGVHLYAISIQNELNFETFYNSATYPLSSQYIAALKRVRAELDQYPDLAGIGIIGPEDLLGGDAYGMWEYGGPIHKNLQYLKNIGADPAAENAIAFFAIHGYAADGASAADATPQQWLWWRNGWTMSPAAGIPANVAGFASHGKRSWMTETSGESTTWLAPTSGFPGQGAFGLALRIHQALSVGDQSAWVYWQMGDSTPVGDQTLTDSTMGANSPKYIAFKHYARFIRPGATRARVDVAGNTNVVASAYWNAADNALTWVVLNGSTSSEPVTITLPGQPAAASSYSLARSSDGSLWQTSTLTPSSGALTFTLPAYGVATINGASGNDVIFASGFEL
jgi:O-glycosyl hydrolase